MPNSSRSTELSGKANPVSTLRQARSLVKAWDAKDSDPFYNTVDQLLERGDSEVLALAVELLERKDEDAAEDMRDEILQTSHIFSDSPGVSGNLACMVFWTPSPEKVDVPALLRSYSETPGLDCKGSSSQFHPKLMPLMTFSGMGPCERWAMVKNMRQGRPAFVPKGRASKKPGWFVLVGIRRAPIQGITSPDDIPHGSIEMRIAAEDAWCEHIAQTMPFIEHVIAPDEPSLVLDEWMMMALDLKAKSENRDNETDDLETLARGMAKVVRGTEAKTEKQVALIRVSFMHNDATGKNGVRACLLDKSGEILNDVFRPTDIDSLSENWLDGLEAIVGTRIEMEEFDEPSAHKLDQIVPPDTVFH